jgi:predicted TPR repeat methyltransferase
MLDQAGERNVYDELVKCELTAYLAGCSETFDVIVSADTLVYFGPLEPVVGAAENALRPGGRLIFTVEELVGTGRDHGYSIGTSGRYRHARNHVQGALKAANLHPEIASAELRLEAGEPVAGLVVLGTKPSAD